METFVYWLLTETTFLYETSRNDRRGANRIVLNKA